MNFVYRYMRTKIPVFEYTLVRTPSYDYDEDVFCIRVLQHMRGRHSPYQNAGLLSVSLYYSMEVYANKGIHTEGLRDALSKLFTEKGANIWLLSREGILSFREVEDARLMVAYLKERYNQLYHDGPGVRPF